MGKIYEQTIHGGKNLECLQTQENIFKRKSNQKSTNQIEKYNFIIIRMANILV